MTREDLHKTALVPLVAAADWAGLVRYWIARQYEPALDAAIDAARLLAANDRRWTELPSFLETVRADPSDPNIAVPPSLRAVDKDTGSLSLALLELYPRVKLCEDADTALIEYRERLFSLGVDAARQAADAAAVAGDEVLGAYFKSMLAKGLYRVGEAQNAVAEWCASLEIYCKLDHQQPEHYQAEIALVLNDLGCAQLELNELEAACQNHEVALEVRRNLAMENPGLYQDEIAISLVSLGNTNAALNCYEAARDNYIEASRIYRELATDQQEDYRVEIASVLNNLGNVLGSLNDLEAARNSHKEALDIRRELARERPETFQHALATSYRNLGIAEYELNNVGAALNGFRKAVETIGELAAQSDQYLHELAISLNNLACAQQSSSDPGALESHKEALAIIHALAEKYPDRYQRDLAMAHSNLGSVQADLNELEAARDSYGNALAIYRKLASQRPNVYQCNVARTLNNLGTVQQDSNDFKAARRSFEEAAKLFEGDPLGKVGGWLAERKRVWTNLGQLYRQGDGLGLPDYEAARGALRRAIDLAEDFRGHLHDRNVRNAMHATMLEPYELLVRTCVDIWDTTRDFAALEEAVHVAERSRARALMERLSEEDLAPRNVPPDQFAEFLHQRRKLDAAKLALEIAMLGLEVEEDALGDEIVAIPGSNNSGRLQSLFRGTQALGGLTLSADEDAVHTKSQSEAAAVVEGAEARLAAIEHELRQADPEWDPDRPVNPLLSSEIQALIPIDLPTAFVQFTVAADTGLAMILTRGDIHCVKLPALSEVPISGTAAEWINAYYGRSKDSHQWEDQMDEELSPLTRALLPLWNALEASGICRAVFSPHRWLHIFPLHACLLSDGKQRASDFFEISYTPSFSILGRCARRNRAASGTALIIGNPTGDLAFTEAEVAAAKGHYAGASVLDKSLATKAAIFAASSTCWLFLYTGHAVFEFDNPILSSLILETNDRAHRAKWLSLGEAFCQLNLGQCALAILNGCESGLLMPDQTDEYLALSSGFLHAGAVSVLASLWAVHDLSSALLMDRFHLERRKGRSVASALKEAARWLRADIKDGDDLLNRVLREFLCHIPVDTPLYNTCVAQAQKYATRAGTQPPFASPAYWAAFIAVGKTW